MSRDGTVRNRVKQSETEMEEHTPLQTGDVYSGSELTAGFLNPVMIQNEL